MCGLRKPSVNGDRQLWAPVFKANHAKPEHATSREKIAKIMKNAASDELVRQIDSCLLIPSDIIYLKQSTCV